MTIQKKLYLAFGGTLLVSIIATALSIWAMQRMSAAIIDLSQPSEDATYDAGQIDTITSDMQAEQRHAHAALRRRGRCVQQADRRQPALNRINP